MNNNERYRKNYYLCHASRKQLISIIKDLNRKVNTLIVLYNNSNEDYNKILKLYNENILRRTNNENIINNNND